MGCKFELRVLVHYSNGDFNSGLLIYSFMNGFVIQKAIIQILTVFLKYLLTRPQLDVES